MKKKVIVLMMMMEVNLDGKSLYMIVKVIAHKRFYMTLMVKNLLLKQSMNMIMTIV